MNTRTTTLAATSVGLLILTGAASWLIAQPQITPSANNDARLVAASALVTTTGRTSNIHEETYLLCGSQEIFDQAWLEHQGDQFNRAAQGWPMTPQIDFDQCHVLLLFGGDRVNCNGYRYIEVIQEHDAITYRVDLITYQGSSVTAKDSGVAAQPWAMIVIPSTKKTLLIEENMQGMKNQPPKWKQRAVFPGHIGIGRPVEGTRQAQQADGQ